MDPYDQRQLEYNLNSQIYPQQTNKQEEIHILHQSYLTLSNNMQMLLNQIQ